MKILKNIFLLLVTVIVSMTIAVPVGDWYLGYIKDYGSFIDARFFAGLPLAYIFFLFIIFTVFGGEGKGKYWWMGVLALPALAFEVYFDLSHIYFPIILGVIGWVIGFGIQKLILKLKN